MTKQPAEVIIAYFLTAGFWLLLISLIFIMGRFNQKVLRFKEKLLSHWKPALLIALLYLAGSLVKSWSLHSLWSGVGAISIFCQSILGLTLAYDLVNYEPLPVVEAFREHHHPWRKLGWMLMIAVFSVLPALLIGTIGLNICQHIFGEVYNPAGAYHALPLNKWQAFFTFFSGAGIAEETTYRLVLMSLFWRLFKRPWTAIILSAIVFGLYHLSPLDGMYRIFWQFPISQLVSSILIGIVWGYLYRKRGYETVVLAHTFTDWLPLLIFMK